MSVANLSELVAFVNTLCIGVSTRIGNCLLMPPPWRQIGTSVTYSTYSISAKFLHWHFISWFCRRSLNSSVFVCILASVVCASCFFGWWLCDCCSAFCEAGHYYSLCWQQYEMCGPAMAAAIAAADNVTNVRCPGLPVAGVTGYGLATGSLRVTLRSIILFAFHCQAQVTWEAFWDPSRRPGRSCCHIIPNFGRKSASKNFSAKIC